MAGNRGRQGFGAFTTLRSPPLFGGGFAEKLQPFFVALADPARPVRFFGIELFDRLFLRLDGTLDVAGAIKCDGQAVENGEVLPVRQFVGPADASTANSQSAGRVRSLASD